MILSSQVGPHYADLAGVSGLDEPRPRSAANREEVDVGEGPAKGGVGAGAGALGSPTDATRMHQDLFAEIRSLRRELNGQGQILAETLRAMHAQAQAIHALNTRDVGVASHRLAAMEAAEFVQSRLTAAKSFRDRYQTLLFALSEVQVPGAAFEFGVHQGKTLRMIVEALPGRQVYGFDSFEGLPESWRANFPAGRFSVEGLPDVTGAELVPGWFRDTLPSFTMRHDEPIAFLHVDCDLLSSTRTVLQYLGARLQVGSIVQFDEYYNYVGWRDHECKAWEEYCNVMGVEYEFIAYTANHEQVAVKVTATEHSPTIRRGSRKRDSAAEIEITERLTNE